MTDDDVVTLARLVLHQRSEPEQRQLAQAVLDLSGENERLRDDVNAVCSDRVEWESNCQDAEAELSDARMTIATLNVLREDAEAERDRQHAYLCLNMDARAAVILAALTEKDWPTATDQAIAIRETARAALTPKEGTE